MTERNNNMDNNNKSSHNVLSKILIVLSAVLLLFGCLFFASLTKACFATSPHDDNIIEGNMASIAERIRESFCAESIEDCKELILKAIKDSDFKESDNDSSSINSDFEESADDSNNIEDEPVLAFDLPGNPSIIEVRQLYDEAKTQEIIALKGWSLQFWINDTLICEKEIPIPAQISIGNDFYEIFGNPYISKDGELVLVQSYTTSNGEQKIDYTILTNNCSKLISTLGYNHWVFQNNDGEYCLAYYKPDESSIFNLAYAGLYFNAMDNDTVLPTPTIIDLNESTVKSVKFGSWCSVSYHCTQVYDISARLDVESYGELDIASISKNFEKVEVDKKFFNFLDETFSPAEYDKRFFKLLQIIDEYKNK